MKFVLDTSAFTSVGKSKKETDSHIKNFADCIAKDKENEYYMPKTVWQELEKVLITRGTDESIIEQIRKAIIIRQPSRMELHIPAQFVNDFVSEFRQRINRGLREAEKAVLEKSKNVNRPDEEVIHDLRDRYRTVMRQGLIDSEEDLDVLLLAKEISAMIIANDKGIEKWADKWGIPYMSSAAD